MSSHTSTNLKASVNYVFVDYENVHKVDPSVIGHKTVYLTLLLGARQTKLDAALVEKLMEHAASVQLVRLASSGKNALDFALAYYVGRSANADPTASFHIVSKDTGFDPLIEHLKSRHILAQRHVDYTSLPFYLAALPTNATSKELFTRVLERLRKNTTNRPKRKKTLISHVRGIAGKDATEESVENIINKLSEAGHLTIGEKDIVTYHV